MFINARPNLKFLANQDTDNDLSPQIISVTQEKDSNGGIREVLNLKFFCRVDSKLISRSSCNQIDVQLSNFDLSYFRTKANLTQTKVAISSIRSNQSVATQSDRGEAQDSLLSKQQQRKNRRKQRKNKKEERKANRKNKKGVSSLTSRDQSNFGNSNAKNRGRNRKNRNVTERGNRKRRSNPVIRPKRSVVALEPKNLAVTAQNSAKFKLIKNQDLYAGVKKVSSINLKNVVDVTGVNIPYTNNRNVLRTSSNSKANLLKPDIVLKIEKKNYSTLSRHRSLYMSNPTSFKAFKKKYNNLIDESIDPLSLFQSAINKSSYQQQRKGLSAQNNLNPKKVKRAVPLIKEIQRQIANTSKSRYEFKKVKSPSRYKVLECTGKISLKDFKNMGSTGYIIFIAKNKDGINLESQSIAFNVNEVLQQRIKQSTKALCNVTRKNSGVSKLVVTNLKSKFPLAVDINVKQITRQGNFLEAYYDSMLGDCNIPASSTLTINDGTIDANPRTPVRFNASNSLFFRTTLNYRGKKYHNAYCASVKGQRGSKRNNNIPNLNIIARLDDTSRGMIVDVTEISSNVAAINLKKYRYNGSSKGKLLDTFDVERNVNQFVFLTLGNEQENYKSARFFDTDVFEDKVYMYVVECIMKNGERKLASDYFIEKYEERTETVKIDDIVIEANDLMTGNSVNLNEDKELTRTVAINFKISKIKTEVDKIIKNLFGNLFEIYKAELTKIKDVQGLVYSIEVQRIEESTGDTITVSKVTADESGNCSFIDSSAPMFPNLIYKLIPRVRPASEVIAAVNAQTQFLAKNTIGSPINFVSAAARGVANNTNNRIFSSQQDKFNDRQVFKRGRIRSPKSVLMQNASDLFADASTGDVSYVSVSGMSDSRFASTISINEGDIKEIRHAQSRPSENLQINNMNTKYYELEFEVDDDYIVDFYAVFIKEGTSIYLDGAIHSVDITGEAKKYSYLVEHSGAAGIIEYYVVPVLKNGNVFSPQLVTAQLIR